MASNNKTVREKVVAFRLSADQYAELEKKVKEEPTVGAPTVGLMARKLAIDFSRDDVSYRDKRKRNLAPELYPQPKSSAVAA
jgi:hypothetical protein